MKIACKVIVLCSLLGHQAAAQTSQQPGVMPVWSEPWSPKAGAEGLPSSGMAPRGPAPHGAALPNVLLPAGSPVESLNPLATTLTVGPVNLGPGDLLEIGVFDSPDLASRVRVNSEGEITFPLLGKLQVGGMTPQQVQSLIRERLITGEIMKDPQVGVFVSEYANQEVFVLGEVSKPGAYPLMGSHQLFDFISAAGGFTQLAGKSITITRHEAPLVPETVRFSHDPNFGTGNPPIAAGDTIYVGRAGMVYVVGDVLKPGGFLMDPDEHMTVMEAIAMAQGTKSTAAVGSVRLIHKTDEGRTETTLNIKQIFRLKGQDPVLHDQDILYVPRNAAKVAMESFLTVGVAAAISATIYHF